MNEADAQDLAEDHAEHGGHMTTFNRVIVVLSVLTALEFAIAGVTATQDNPDAMIGFAIGVLLLVGLAAVKAVLVAQYFMHIKYDPRILGLIVFTPVILGAPLIALPLFDALRGPWQ